MKKGNFENKINGKLYDYVPDMEIPECNFINTPFIQNSDSQPFNKKKIYLNRFYYISGIAASLIILLSASYYFINDNINTETIANENIALLNYDIPEIKEEITIDLAKNNIEHTDRVEISESFENKTSNKNIVKSSVLLTRRSAQPRNETSINNEEKDSYNINGSADSSQIESAKSKSETYSNTTNFYSEYNDNTLPRVKNKVNKKNKNFSLGLIASNSTTSEGASNSSEIYTPYIRLAHDTYGFKDIKYDEIYKDFKHKVPIRAGLSFGYYLTKRIMIESGIIYSFLESDFHLNSGADEKGVQKLHYIGVPVSLSFDLISRPRYRVYLGAGCEADFNIRSIQKYRVDDIDIKHESRDKYPVWSYRFKAGAAWNLFGNSEIYIEPSYAKYNSKSELKSAWTDNKFVIDLNFGIRTNF